MGACVLEKELGRNLPHLACRHPISELVLGAAFQAVMGPSSGPQVLLIKRFQSQWKQIDQSKFQPAVCDPSVEQHVAPLRNELLAFCAAHLEAAQPRDGYLELLELAVIFLGGQLARGVRIMEPGPIHHARWMSKALYSVKIWLF